MKYYEINLVGEDIVIKTNLEDESFLRELSVHYDKTDVCCEKSFAEYVQQLGYECEIVDTDEEYEAYKTDSEGIWFRSTDGEKTLLVDVKITKNGQVIYVDESYSLDELIDYVIEY